MREYLVRVRVLHHRAEVHDAHRVRDVLDDREVVRDEEVREAEVLLQPLEQVDYLRLDGHVQRGNGLVADYEVRVERQRAGDADALPLAAGELVRIAVLVVFLQPAGAHDAADVVVKLLLGHDVVLADRLAYYLAHGYARAEAGVRVLEDYLYARSEPAQLLTAHLEDVLPVEDDLAGGLFDEAEYRPARGGFAAAGLADEAHRLPALYVEGDAVHSAHVADGAPEKAALDGEPLYEVLDLDEVFAFRPGSVLFDVFHIKAPPRSRIWASAPPCPCPQSASRRRRACR